MKSNREHSFDFELAEIVGIEKALLLKNVTYWTTENCRRGILSMYEHGTWWTEESLGSLAEKYKYMKRGNLSRWLKQLHEDKWILLIKTVSGKNRYAVGPVFNAWNAGEDWVKVFQNETGRCFKMKQKVFQNETEGISKRNNGVFQNETHYVDDIEINVENNNVAPLPQNGNFESFEEEEKKSPPPNSARPPAPAEAPYYRQTTTASGPYVPFDFNREVEALRSDQMARANFSMVTKIPSAKFDEYLAAFVAQEAFKQSSHKNTSDFRQHFLNFSRLKYLSEQAESKAPKSVTKSGIVIPDMDYASKGKPLF